MDWLDSESVDEPELRSSGRWVKSRRTEFQVYFLKVPFQAILELHRHESGHAFLRRQSPNRVVSRLV